MTTFDPIRLEVLWNRLISIVNEQAAALIRTSFTTIVRETEDLSCGIFDRAGTMIAQAETGTPGHINSMATGVKHFLKRYPPETLLPGDVLLTNDPWLMSGHKHDITIVTPIFIKGVLQAFAASTCHVEDIGGRVLSAEASDVFEEGLAIPIMKLYEAGKPNKTLFEIITANVRMPEPVWGDLNAQIVANEVSIQKLAEFLEQNQLDSLTPLANVLLEKSEQAMRDAIRTLPEGSYSHSIVVDGFDDPLTIAVTLHVKEGEILADYAGSSPQVDRGINVVLNYTHAYTTYPLKAALCPEVPNNDGSFRPIKVTAPEGCVMNAKFPAPVAGRHLIGHMAAPAIYGALAKIAPQLVNAESSSLGITQLNGYTSDGEIFVKNYFATGGMGARPTTDGLSAKSFPTNVQNSPVEVTENTSPLFISRKEFIPDSGGAGKYRGGLGQRFTLSIRSDKPAVLSCLYERTKHPALGYEGGKEGTVGAVILNGKEHLHAKKKHVLKPGHEVTIEFAGGGGFYPPEERDPQFVLEDVRNGFVSRENARRLYKVVISEDGRGIDEAATAELRKGKG
ncbi:MAG: hydantoinase B/oxoprolinase family protein [Candidatus Tectomicrobia bacterium]|nr:hydantoinase B/oxoprolinase family protein [Candidatus Tectomicrobia bacterium]